MILVGGWRIRGWAGGEEGGLEVRGRWRASGGVLYESGCENGNTRFRDCA